MGYFLRAIVAYNSLEKSIQKADQDQYSNNPQHASPSTASSTNMAIAVTSGVVLTIAVISVIIVMMLLWFFPCLVSFTVFIVVMTSTTAHG